MSCHCVFPEPLSISPKLKFLQLLACVITLGKLLEQILLLLLLSLNCDEATLAFFLSEKCLATNTPSYGTCLPLYKLPSSR